MGESFKCYRGIVTEFNGYNSDGEILDAIEHVSGDYLNPQADDGAEISNADRLWEDGYLENLPHDAAVKKIADYLDDVYPDWKERDLLWGDEKFLDCLEGRR